jgi:hypothetical protein
MNLMSKKWAAFVVAASRTVAAAQTNSNVPFRSQDYQSKAFFELVVNKSSVLRPGARSIVTQSAFVKLAHRLVPGNSDGLEIQFFTKPLTGAGITDVLKNDARELRKSDYAALVLFLDKKNKVWQADLRIVVPGTTVARTVAWKPEELARYFSDYKFDGKRLVLKSKGSFSESESGQETMKLSWNVDLDLPVFREAKR